MRARKAGDLPTPPSSTPSAPPRRRRPVAEAHPGGPDEVTPEYRPAPGPVVIPGFDQPPAKLDPVLAGEVIGYATRRMRTAALAYDDPLLVELRGRQARQTLDRMALDPIIMGIVERVGLIMRSATWSIMAGGEEQPEGVTDLDKEFADEISDNLANLDGSFQNVMAQTSDMLIWGFSLHETVFKRMTDASYRWAGFFPRDQRTVYDWRVDEYTGRMKYCIQLTDDGRMATIPEWKLLHFRTHQMSGRPEGRPLVRNAFIPWTDKQELRRIVKLGIRRDLTGIPIARVPPSMLSTGATDDERSLLTIINTMVQQLDRDELEGVTFPGRKDEQGRDTGWDLELLKSPGTRQLNLEQLWSINDRQIAVALLGEVVLMGIEKVGSYAMADIKTNTLARAISAWMDDIAEYMRNRACVVYQRYNPRYAEAQRPVWHHSELDEISMKDLGEFVQQTMSVGGITPGPELDASLRRKAKLPLTQGEEEV